jgi:hypothetical protein
MMAKDLRPERIIISSSTMLKNLTPRASSLSFPFSRIILLVRWFGQAVRAIISL